ncbi:hypothetical protein CANARDRAFT_7984 [[Candida] arabinofermentans NRRL YB-2248]|uniref:Uncharacterized protein n=1 Tax=[Candida] arabinofermentans NRRL YB-2248 TaxID=983967 RepID=A0A1E4T0R3_9ASCO|nr:hypothetical protein CANARDRAFT_7984 [[Candida] arabinofermentans NRRL YB-2248]
MSSSNNFYNRLGPQGRSLLTQIQQQQPNQTLTQQDQLYNITAPSRLDFLFHEIANPKSTTTPQQILSYLAYYYPKLKNEQNVQLLTYSFLRCPLFFNSNRVISFQENYKIIECFNYIMDKKFRVSQPTLPFYKFYHSILTALIRFTASDFESHWKIIPLMVGCIMSIETRKNYDSHPPQYQLISKIDQNILNLTEKSLTYSFKNYQLGNDLESLNLICLGCINNSISNDKVFTDILKFSPHLPNQLLQLIFSSPYGLDNGKVIVSGMSYSVEVGNKAVLKHLGNLALLYSKLIRVHPNLDINLDDIDLALNKIQTFTECLVKRNVDIEDPNNTDIWLLLRQVFFSVVVMFENLVSLFFEINDSTLNNRIMPRFSRKILTSLFNMSFIIDKIGTGGFEAYNFIYLSCLNSIIEYDLKVGELLIQVWTSNINFGELESSSIERSKLLFDLNFIESMITIVSDDLKFNMILPIIHRLVHTSKNQPILESSHSVMLKFFTILDTHFESDDDIQIDYNLNMAKIKNQILDYLTLSLDQFPDQLSLTQVGIIVETLARIVFPNSIIYESDKELCKSVLNLIYNRCQSTGDDLVTNEISNEQEGFKSISSDSENEQDDQSKLKTKRASLTSLLIRIIPLIPIHDFECWLNLIYDNLICSTKDSTEKVYLLDKLWGSILGTNKYYPQKGNLGINWWYEYVNIEFEDHSANIDPPQVTNTDDSLKPKL